MKARKRIKFWKNAIKYYRQLQTSRTNHHEFWGFGLNENQKAIDRYSEYERKSIEKLIIAYKDRQIEIDQKIEKMEVASSKKIKLEFIARPKVMNQNHQPC